MVLDCREYLLPRLVTLGILVWPAQIPLTIWIQYLSSQGRENLFLEYDLSRMVQNLANPKKKKVGFVSSLPIEADPLKRYRPWEILKHLREAFDVEKITLENPVPEDVDLLMVVHPREMDEVDRYYIDQHIMRGEKQLLWLIRSLKLRHRAIE